MLNPAIREDRALDFLRGDVKQVEIREYKVTDGKTSGLKERSVRTYDRHGNRISVVYYQADGSVRLRQESTIAPSGAKVAYTNYDASGTPSGGGRYVYESGVLKAKIHDGEVEETYENDEDGRITKVVYPSTGSGNLYKYDDNGFVAIQREVPADPSGLTPDEQGLLSAVSSMLGTGQSQIFEFDTDESGVVTEQRVLDQATGALKFKIVRTVNEYGDVNQEVSFQNGEVYGRTAYRYRYDSRGNWVERVAGNPGGPATGLKRRDIEYFD